MIVLPHAWARHRTRPGVDVPVRLPYTKRRVLQFNGSGKQFVYHAEWQEVPIITGGVRSIWISYARRSLGMGTESVQHVINQYTIIPTAENIISRST